MMDVKEKQGLQRSLMAECRELEKRFISDIDKPFQSYSKKDAARDLVTTIYMYFLIKSGTATDKLDMYKRVNRVISKDSNHSAIIINLIIACKQILPRLGTTSEFNTVAAIFDKHLKDYQP